MASKKNRKGYYQLGSNWADYPGVGRVTDKEVADFTIKHMSLFDRLFRPRKVAMAALCSQDILFRVLDEPGAKRWKY